jgi:hypothetical protein
VRHFGPDIVGLIVVAVRNLGAALSTAAEVFISFTYRAGRITE